MYKRNQMQSERAKAAMVWPRDAYGGLQLGKEVPRVSSRRHPWQRQTKEDMGGSGEVRSQNIGGALCWIRPVQP